MEASGQVAEFLSRPDEEGDRLRVYNDQHGLPSIGIGHLLTKSELYSGVIIIGGVPISYHNGLSEDQVRMLLHQDIRPAETFVDNLVKVPLAQNQFDALAIFAFNVGVHAFATSTLLKLLNQGHYDQVPGQMRLWNKVAHVVSKGLTRRREDEIAIWECNRDGT